MTDSVLYGFWKLTAVVLCENSEGLLSATNPKPIRGHIPLPAQASLIPAKGRALRTRGGLGLGLEVFAGKKAAE